MKKALKYSIFVVLLTMMSSCQKELQDLNIDRINPTSTDPVLLLNSSIYWVTDPIAPLFYDMGIVQQLISTDGGFNAGANFNQENRSLGNIFESFYQNMIKNTHDVLVKTKDLTGRRNLYNMARIYQSYLFMMLTDEYGAIPYTQGGAGYTDQIFYPQYDQQKDIYPALIQELTDASAALDPAGTIEKQDLLYAGDISKWKKFGYSLLLRAGMRLSKIDPAKAQTVVQAAFNGGVILSNADNAYMRNDANFTQTIARLLNGNQSANFYLAKPFVGQLKSTNDPRLASIAVRYVGAKSGNDQTTATASTDPLKQIGLPIGYDNNSINAQVTADGLASHYDYSQADRARIVKSTAPTFFVTASQTNLLLAEARLRGWITSGTVAQYFADGIKAHMDQMATYDAGCAVSAAARDAYVAANPIVAGTELQQINTQYWIASFLNGLEAFANFRRSGYPNLIPNSYGQPGNPDVPQGTFIRRLTYPLSELSVNSNNVNAASQIQGVDKLSTRVWWDK
jgi:hypothetical protein